MKKLLIIAIIIASCTGCSPWTQVPSLEGEQHFIDLSSVLKNGSLRKVWELRDLKITNEYGAKSELTRMEYDCYNERGKILTVEFFSENMGKGKVVRNINCADINACWWDGIVPGSVGAIRFDLACKN